MIPWVTGDVITAERLNGMNNVMVANFTTNDDGETWACDKTFSELSEFIKNDGFVIATSSFSSSQINIHYLARFFYDYESENHEMSIIAFKSFEAESYLDPDPDAITVFNTEITINSNNEVGYSSFEANLSATIVSQ